MPSACDSQPLRAQVGSANPELPGLWRFRQDDEADTGGLRLLDEISVLPAGYAGTSHASDLLLAPDGRLLYALDRLFDAVSLLALDGQGQARLLDHVWTRRGAFSTCATSTATCWRCP